MVLTRCLFTAFTLVSLGGSVTAQSAIFERPLSPRIANYSMNAKLLPDEKIVQGEYTLRWWNSSRDTIRTLQFHLYLNAFKNSRSTFMRERPSAMGRDSSECGWVDIDRLQLATGEALPYAFIQPDDDNSHDQTVIEVALSKPLVPGATIEVVCQFRSKLPRAGQRTGFADNEYFFVAQWFPKIGVWENGRWNCHQFHANSEFYADFGVYDLELTVPKRFVVGANAVLLKKEEKSDDVVFQYRQEDVIDVVWTASPEYFVDTQRVAVDGHEVTVTYLLSPGQEPYLLQYREAVPRMLNYFHQWLGRYPYPNLTIVDVPADEAGSIGGMEYPTLITTGNLPTFGFFEPSRHVRYFEIVLFHEFAHNYCMGLLASNEFEEPWVDEGFTSYFEHRALVEYSREFQQSEFGTVLGFPIQSLEYHRGSYLTRPMDGTIAGAAWEHTPGFYQTAAYSKPVLLLTTLERMVGTETMNTITRTYFERWKFRHPRSSDFFAVVEEVTGREMDGFVKDFVYGNGTVDHEVVAVRRLPKPIVRGWFDGEDGMTYVDSVFATDSIATRISFRNNGSIAVPAPIWICLANGDTLRDQWDGRSGLTVRTYRTASEVTSVWIDPEQTNVLDLCLANNACFTAGKTSGIWGITGGFIAAFQELLQILFLWM